ncbi:unnamed protein product [Dovyalis caffra]|uniref:tRNA-guanine(15) transglycosylase-like domain-containing protein n=1 Tax=Dovyalis caffra TaxID=77055 RepID=A0AAV1R1Q1_9ROSI|nr:unnamed protein product [Dovyalis caffra]
MERAGVFQLGNCPSIETPALLLSTRKGLPHFISPDLLPSLPLPDSSLLQVSPLHFLEGISSKTISSIGGLHKMLGLNDYGLVAVARDSIQCLPESSATNKLGASFETPCGRALIKPTEYMGMISSLRPNLWATLADEVPAWVSKKRNKISVDRTVKWLDECIALSPADGVAFGAIVGGSDVEERRRCAREIAKRNVSGQKTMLCIEWGSANSLKFEGVEVPLRCVFAGYWIGGFGFGESMDERPALLSVVTDSLPKEGPRLISGLGLPEEVLQGVAAGIDLFDSSYIYHLTIGGFALTFPLDTKTNTSDFKLTGMGTDHTKINLKATVYRHNTHHYLGFFQSIREAIKEGRFNQFQQMFVEKRRNHLAEVAVCA